MSTHISGSRALLTLIAPVALLALTGCPKTPEPLPPPADPAPRIALFTASTHELPEGGAVTLRWETEHAQSAQIVDTRQGAISGSDTLSGSIEVQVTQTSLFILTAQGTRGRTDTAVVQVRAGPGDSEILFVAQPSVIARGEPVTLAWAVSRADDLRITDAEGNALDLGGQGAAGSLTVNPDEDSTWTLHSHGRTATVDVRLRPDVTRFDATPKGAVRGQPVTLTWETTSATRVRLEDGEGRPLTQTEDPAEVAKGTWSFDVDVNEDRNKVFNFRLFAEGSTSEAVTSVPLAVYISGQSRVQQFDAARYVRAGQPFTVSWRTVEADRVQLLADGEVIYETLDARSAEVGSTELQPLTKRTLLTLRATSVRGGFAEETKPVSPVGTTQVVSVTATPSTITQGGEPVTLSWNLPSARRIRVEHSSDGTVFNGIGDELEQHAITLYPNTTGTYTIVADNTLGDEVRPTQAVTVQQPATWQLSGTGPVFQGSEVTLRSPIPDTQLIGFSHGEVDVETVADAFIDIEQTATRSGTTPPLDALNMQVRLPFEFWMWGERVQGIFSAFTDGVLVFQPYARTKNVPAPIPNLTHEPRLVAPFWADLESASDETTLSWEVLGQAPEQLLVVQWSGMRVKGHPTSRVSFQAQISQTGVIRFAYRDVELPQGVTATIGVQGPMPGLGVSYPSLPQSDTMLTFFGPRTEVTFSPDRHGHHAGFVAMPDGLMRVDAELERFVSVGQLAVTEALPLPHSSLGEVGQWVEVRNDSRVAVDLEGFVLETPAGTYTIPANTTAQPTIVPAGGHLLFGGSKNATENGGAPVQHTWAAPFALEGTPAALSWVALKDSNGALWSELTFASPVEGRSVIGDPNGLVHAGDVQTTPLRGISCTGTGSFGDPLLNQVGTPGARKGCFGYRMERREPSFRDISLTGNRLGTGTTSAAHVPMLQHLYGSPTVAFGQPVTQLGISRNGYVTFDAPVVVASPYVAATLSPGATTPNRTAALFGRALNFGAVTSTGVYTQRLEANEDPLNPVAHWIVQWHHLAGTSTSSTSEDLNFQLKVFDDGVLEYHYGHLSSHDNTLTGLGFGVVAWLEGDNDVALPISVQRAGIRPHTAFRFIPE